MACSKEVIDFTNKTDKEILDFIAAGSGATCGRFANEQLNRHLESPTSPRRIWWKYWMSVAASVLLLSAKSDAQGAGVKAPVVTAPSGFGNGNNIHATVGKVLVETPGRNGAAYSVEGIVRDEDNNPVPFAIITLKGTAKAVHTDQNGSFSMQLDNTRRAVLEVAAIGFEKKEVRLSRRLPSQSALKINIRLQQSIVELMGDVVVVKKQSNGWRNYFK